MWRIDQAPVPVGELQHRRPHPVPYLRHHAEPASPSQWWRHGHHYLVRRDRERYHLVDARRDMATRTPRAVRGRLVARLQYSGGDQHQRLVRHLPLGLGLLNVARLKRRYRPDRVLRLILDSRHGAPVVRPWGEVPALIGSAPPATPPRSRHREHARRESAPHSRGRTADQRRRARIVRPDGRRLRRRLRPMRRRPLRRRLRLRRPSLHLPPR